MDKKNIAALILIPTAVIAVFLTWKTNHATAAGSSPQTAQGAAAAGGGQGRTRQTPEQRLAALMTDMTKDVGLTDAQQAQIKPLEQDVMAKGREIRQDKKMTREEKTAKNKANQTAASEAVKKLLTPDQLPKYAAWEAKREAMRKRFAGGQGGPGGARPGASKTPPPGFDPHGGRPRAAGMSNMN